MKIRLHVFIGPSVGEIFATSGVVRFQFDYFIGLPDIDLNFKHCSCWAFLLPTRSTKLFFRDFVHPNL